MTTGSTDATRRPLVVRCPTCGGNSRFDATNPSRPFCSVRCKGVDLGAWASERYRVAGPPVQQDASSSDSPSDDDAPTASSE